MTSTPTTFPTRIETSCDFLEGNQNLHSIRILVPQFSTLTACFRIGAFLCQLFAAPAAWNHFASKTAGHLWEPNGIKGFRCQSPHISHRISGDGRGS